MSSVATGRIAYHHGNLRTALLDAGLALTRTGGPDALVLRDVTRRVGVSPNAAYRHFADRDALLRAVAAEVHRMVGAQMGAEPVADARAQLRAVGLAYVEFALGEPGWFETAFGDTEVVPGAAVLPPPLARLSDALDALVQAGDLDPAARPGAEWPCWSAVHGLALLALHGPLRHQSPMVVWEAAERTVDAIIAGLLR